MGSREERHERLRLFALTGLNPFVLIPPWGYMGEVLMEFAREVRAHE
jgi:hypothetical protein